MGTLSSSFASLATCTERRSLLGLKQIFVFAPVFCLTNVYKLHQSNQLYIITWNNCSSFWYQNPCTDLFPRPRLPPLVFSVARLINLKSGKSLIFGILLGTWSGPSKPAATGRSTTALWQCLWMWKAMFSGMRQKGKSMVVERLRLVCRETSPSANPKGKRG